MWKTKLKMRVTYIWSNRGRYVSISWKLVVIPKIPQSQDFRTTFKQNLTCIFVSVRLNLLLSFHSETPCTESEICYCKTLWVGFWIMDMRYPACPSNLIIKFSVFCLSSWQHIFEPSVKPLVWVFPDKNVASLWLQNGVKYFLDQYS